MRSLTLGALTLVALLLLPGAQAGTLYDVEGKWFWGATGTVGVKGLPGMPAHARIFVGDGGSYFWRVSFDPFGLAYLQCVDGAGFLALNGAPVAAAQACSLALNGAFAVPRMTLAGLGLGQLPGQVGQYLGPIELTGEGSGSFRVA